MSNYKVEKGVPLPSKSGFPFGEMEIGDSFLIPLNGVKVNVMQMKVNQSAKSFKNSFNQGFKVKTRKTDEGLRVFRIE